MIPLNVEEKLDSLLQMIGIKKTGQIYLTTTKVLILRSSEAEMVKYYDKERYIC